MLNSERVLARRTSSERVRPVGWRTVSVGACELTPTRYRGNAPPARSVKEEGSLWRRLRSPQGFTATATYFVLDC
jgi:hypothetical protein